MLIDQSEHLKNLNFQTESLINKKFPREFSLAPCKSQLQGTLYPVSRLLPQKSGGTVVADNRLV